MLLTYFNVQANSSELFPDCLNVLPFALVLHHEGGDQIYEMRGLFVVVGLTLCQGIEFTFISIAHCCIVFDSIGYVRSNSA